MLYLSQIQNQRIWDAFGRRIALIAGPMVVDGQREARFPDQLVDEALLFQLLDLSLDCPLSLFHPGWNRIDVGPTNREGRLAVTLDTFGGRARVRGGSDAESQSQTKSTCRRTEQ